MDCFVSLAMTIKKWILGLKNQKRDKSKHGAGGSILELESGLCKRRCRDFIFAMRNLCFASRVSEIRLGRLSSSRGAAIKGLSRKDKIP